MPTTVSTIIVNYNAGGLLRQCIESLFKCSLPVEIIVVDNASVDGSLAGLEDFPGLKLIKNTKNTGFAAACNTGVDAATSDYVLFLNPDSTIEPEALSSMMAVLQQDKQVGMVGAMLCNLDGSEQPGGRRVFPTPRRAFNRAFGLSGLGKFFPGLFADFLLHKDPLPTGPVIVEAISGACMLVKREAIKDVGLWDEGYFLHCEDLDWCMRFGQKGWKIKFVPNARVIHALGVCGRSRPLFVEWHKHKGMCRFYCKFFRHQYPGILMYLVIFAVWMRFGFVALYHTGKQVGTLFQAKHE